MKLQKMMREVEKMRIFKKAVLFIAAAGLFFTFAGCAASNVEKVNVDEVKAYADAVVEKMFAGINEKDYIKFTQDFDQQMKNAVTEAKFSEIFNQLGKCESKGIIGADKYKGYTRAYYRGKSSGLSRDATFTIVFSATGDKKVSGFFYK